MNEFDEPASTETKPGGGQRMKELVRRYPGQAVLLVAAAIGLLMWLTQPSTQRRPSEPRRPLVEVAELTPTSHRIEMEAHGRVLPVTEVSLVAQVDGRIERVHPNFVPGGQIPAGEPIVVIDDRDYRAALRGANADVAIAREELQLERGRRRAAVAEWEQFRDRSTDALEKDLATRGPQLRTAQANLDRAESALAQAELDLERTRIELPFPVRMIQTDGGVGSLARNGSPVGRVVAMHALRVGVSMPARDLHWFADQRGAAATIYPRSSTIPVTGYIREILANVEPQGSLGRVVVDIPLAVRSGHELPVRVGEFVRVALQGQTLDNVYVVPRRALRGDDKVWLLDRNEQLQIRPIRILFSGPEYVVVGNGLQPGERMIISQLARPIDGMSLRLADAAPETVTDGAQAR